MKNINTEKYWDHHYEEMNTPWDIGHVNQGLVDLAMNTFDKSDKLLFPGAGIGHEAAWLFEKGYENVYICDWAPHAISTMNEKYPEFPVENIIIGDFFKLHGDFDGIIEQTFLCAISRDMRKAYAAKCKELLGDDGTYLGVLFNKEFPMEGPPFGGSNQEYQALFSNYFNIERLEDWKNSIPPRKGSECIIIMRTR